MIKYLLRNFFRKNCYTKNIEDEKMIFNIKISARKMLTDLGYGSCYDDGILTYYKKTISGAYLEINFIEKDETVEVISRFGIDKKVCLSPAEILAIYKQAKEYGWIGEEDDNN